MARFIRKRFPILFVATYFVVAASMIGFLIYPILFTEASLQVNFTNTGAATVTIGPSSSMTAVMNVVIPDAWNSGAYTADILMQNSGINYWQGSTLTAIPALGTTSGVGYKDAGAAGFQGGDTEAVIRDLDADSVYTSAADTLVDADGTATNTAGATALSGGDSLYDIVGGDNVVADSVVTPTNVWQDSDANLRYISNKSAEAAVAGGNGDIALSLTALTNPTVTLGGTANQWDAAEDVYIDVDTSLTVTTGDTRVTATAGGAVGSVVACPADADCLTVIEALTQGKVTGGDGIWAVGTEYVYDDINNSGANGVSAGDNRLTAIVAESVVLGTPTDGDTGTNVAATAGWVKEVNALWTPGNDLFIENVAGKFTYSASADVTVYVGGGVAAGDSLTDFVADCDGGGVGTQVCKFTGAGTIDATKSIYVDEGTAGGAAPNSVVDRQDDQLAGMGIQNTGTAVNSTDISSVTLWADDGDGIFQGVGVDTSLGAMTVNPGDSKEWRLSGLTQAIPIGGKRIFAAILTTITPTNGRTLKFQIPVYNDVGADGVASSAGDVGVFMSSTNDGPTDAVVLNANTQTIDSAGPVVTSRVTADADGDGQIDRIIFTTDEALNDNFTITLDVAVYAGEAYVTGGAANDNIFWVNFTESGSMDTGATPNTQLTVNTKLKDLYGNVIATDGAPVASTDGAAPILIGGSYRDIDGNGAIDTLRVTWSESVTMTGSTAVDWTIVGGDINATFSVATDSPGLGTDKDITVTADAGETNSATAPTIAYDNDDTNNSVVDAALNPAGTTGPATMIDLAAPAVLTATFYDASPATNDGKLDRITVVWSENISAVADGSADWAISSAANFAALTETAVICNSGAAAANECRYLHLYNHHC
ncbi:hypothetical protein HZB93_00455 [Candidatus Falkowbacteria bacterium]|nr:hypothetical protein [Candidatus Falkowbacteria bacterium]